MNVVEQAGWSEGWSGVPTTAVVAVVAAAATLWLLQAPRAAVGGGRRPRVPLGWAFAPLAGIALVDQPRLLVLAAIGAAVLVAARRLLLRRRVLAEAARTRAQAVEACTSIVAELGVGCSPLEALEHAARDWPVLDVAVHIGRSGGSVPHALRDASSGPGAADLRIIAAAWQIAHRTGHGLADALERVVAELRAAERTRRIVTGELASARATARLVAALPVAALAMGSGAGASPLGFLLTEPLGLACLAGGLAFGLAGLLWIEAIAASVERA